MLSKKNAPWQLALIVGLVSGAWMGFEYGKQWQQRHLPGSPYSTSGEVIDHWYDGDTVTLANSEKIRLLGIDTPELKPRPGTPRNKVKGRYPQPGALEARDYVKKNWPAGTRVEIRREGKDKYGRTLAKIYGADGRCVNDELLEHGLAKKYR